ncbi:peptidoglycan-recognition protein SC2-like [Biomphalaria glabrata]|uniref:Peptidoglycan-recognition protein n=1 Tax=Biomphalaria glabrata TaxID=6526 RepID=A0A9U8DW48_BIOGL|nr:peptidoglycan-recognition protein SC2-like [Biomphalaria glabrata]
MVGELLVVFVCRQLSLVLGACPHIITRAQWGARHPTSAPVHIGHPVHYAFIHHSAGPECHDRATCQAQVKAFQNYHMDTRGWPDIGYTFVIGGDGSIFEARGWNVVGAHTLNYNSVGNGFCFIGTFTNHLPTAAAQQAVKDLIACGVAEGHIEHNYVLRGHRDMGSTECPGTAFWHHIKTWPHY